MILYTTINIIANTMIEPGMSGGNRIFIECAKRWIKASAKISVFTSDAGEKICEENGLSSVQFFSWKLPFTTETKFNKSTVLLFYILGTVIGCITALRTPLLEDKVIIYSSSDFWPDSISGFIMKLKNKNAKWVAGFFLFAPKPWQKDSPYGGKGFLTGLFYYLTQLPIYWVVRRYADMVFVTNEPDVEKFITKKRGKNKIVAIRGGVDIESVTEYLNSKKVIPTEKRKYDACFVGRLHPQKGVLELIDIWRFVCEKKKNAKLAIIGIGKMEKQIKEKIIKYNLESSIELLGFKDGVEKIRIFQESKVAVYPAILDHWSMAPVEAMSCGLPLVAFDILTLKTLHPVGIIKAPCYDLGAFAESIVKLLYDERLYKKTQADAIKWAKEWDWDKRADEIMKDIRELNGG